MISQIYKIILPPDRDVEKLKLFQALFEMHPLNSITIFGLTVKHLVDLFLGQIIILVEKKDRVTLKMEYFTIVFNRLSG